QIGDQAMQDVVESLNGQRSTALKRARKPMNKRKILKRSTKTTIIAVAVAALAGFVGGYNSRAAKHPADIALARSPEIRRAIPVEPEIRKAIPVQTSEPKVSKDPSQITPDLHRRPRAQ